MKASGRDEERAGFEAVGRPPSNDPRVVTGTGTVEASPPKTAITDARFELALARAALDDALDVLPHFDDDGAIATRAVRDLMGQLITAKNHLSRLEADSVARA